jgi:hypothetical protein
MSNIIPLDRVENMKDIITLNEEDKNTLFYVAILSVPNPLFTALHCRFNISLTHFLGFSVVFENQGFKHKNNKIS